IETASRSRRIRLAWSHPSRVRGLKHCVTTIVDLRSLVAPFTGAWIETVGRGWRHSSSHVAPFTGAWIETTGRASCETLYCVAPFTGAWIETIKWLVI